MRSHKDHCPHFHCSIRQNLVSKWLVGVAGFCCFQILEIIPNEERLIGDSIGHFIYCDNFWIFETIWFLLEWYRHRLHIKTCKWRMAKHSKTIHVHASLISFFACFTTYLCLLFRFIYCHKKNDQTKMLLLFIFSFFSIWNPFSFVICDSLQSIFVSLYW